MVFQVSLSKASKEKWQDDWYIPPRRLLEPVVSIPQKWTDYCLGGGYYQVLETQQYAKGTSVVPWRVSKPWLESESSDSCINVHEACHYAIN